MESGHTRVPRDRWCGSPHCAPSRPPALTCPLVWYANSTCWNKKEIHVGVVPLLRRVSMGNMHGWSLPPHLRAAALPATLAFVGGRRGGCRCLHAHPSCFVVVIVVVVLFGLCVSAFGVYGVRWGDCGTRMPVPTPNHEPSLLPPHMHTPKT